MKIMAVNAGSSSLKFQLLNMPEESVIASGLIERIGSENGVVIIKFNGKKFETELPIKDHKVAVALLFKGLEDHKIIKNLNEIEGVGHRVVQGGELFQSSVIINEDVMNKIDSLCDLAPLHNPANLMGIKAFVKELPNITQVAVFDTVFHSTMKEEAYMYATPYEWYKKYGVRKYGAHGTSHQFVSERVGDHLNNPNAKIIVCHLGNGASLCAVKDKVSIDTSMGLTPLEGIPMGTRSGDIDPAIFGLISRKEGKSIDEILNSLNKESGYLGISGISNDARDIQEGIDKGDKRAMLTRAIQAKRIVDYIGSYHIYLEGLDAIAFTAGIGENSPWLRTDICERLKVLGVKIDEKANMVWGPEERLISTKDSKVKVFVIPTNEEVMIARDVVKLAKK